MNDRDLDALRFLKSINFDVKRYENNPPGPTGAAKYADYVVALDGYSKFEDAMDDPEYLEMMGAGHGIGSSGTKVNK